MKMFTTRFAPWHLMLALICSSVFEMRTAWAGDVSQGKETYFFKVRGTVTYRCYGGYGTQKVFDSRTKAPCDNKTKSKVLFDERVKIEIKVEPNPADSKDLGGDLQKSVQFEGRKFTAAVSLFKLVDVQSTTPYRLRVVAIDDEPGRRQTAIYTDVDQVKNLNALTVQYSSTGQPEEINYQLLIEPVK